MPITLKYDSSAAKRRIVEFTNGTLPNGVEMDCKSFCHKKKNNVSIGDQKMLILHGQHLNYVGNNYERKEAYPHAHKYVVVEVNKHTGIGKLYDTDHFKLRPILPDDMDDEGSDEEKLKTQTQMKQDERSFAEKQDDLTEVFGSHKRQRAMVTRQKNRVADSTEAVQTSVEAMMQKSGFLSSDEDVVGTKTIIFCNKDANTVDEVYPLEKIIPGEVSKALIAEGQKFIRPASQSITEWRENGELWSCRFIVEHAQNPPRAIIENPDVHVEYACCLQLLVYLIRVFKLKSSEYRKKEFFNDVSDPVRTWLLTEFFLGGSGKDRKMPTRMKDKVLAVAIVVTWNIDSFFTNAELFQEAFAISRKKLSTHVRALGGSVKSQTRGGVKAENIVLSLPLQFLKTSQGPRSRK